MRNDYFFKKAQTKINLKKKNNIIPVNNSNSFTKNCDLYKEDINYNIESTKTMESRENNEKYNSLNDKESMSINKTINSHKFNTINITKKPIIYDKNFENQMNIQNGQLNHLLNNKLDRSNGDEKKLKSLNINELLPSTIDSLNTNYYTKRTEKNEKRLSKMINYSYNNKHNNQNVMNKNNGKSLDFNFYSLNDDDNLYKNKYINLFRKYSKINKNNKISNIFIIKLQSAIDKLKSENEYLINLLKLEKEKNKENIDNNNLLDKANEWKEQVIILRKDLVLSQAVVKSLRTELDILKNKNIKQKEFNDCDKNNEYFSNINKYENNENNFLKKSLSEKNTLISNLLEENYKSNQLLKSIGININEYNTINQDKFNNSDKNISIIKEMKNVISQYENKFDYFNDYINNIKKQISSIYKDINQIINDNRFEKSNNNNQKYFLLSESFYEEINNIKDKIKDINIDLYNLDYSNDIKCLDNYSKLIKIIINEFFKIMLINKNFVFINEKENKSIIDLFMLSNNLISNNNFKKSLNDILEINNNINKLYKQKTLNEQNKNIDIDLLISNQKKEIEKKKKSLFNNSNINKTHYIANRNKNNSKNNKNNENIIKNYSDYNNTNTKNIKQYYLRNKSFEAKKFYTISKKANKSRDKIIVQNKE